MKLLSLLFIRGGTFRPEYKDVGSIRSLVTRAKILALTATATTAMVTEITRLLNVNEDDMRHVAILPDRYTQDIIYFFSNIVPVQSTH